MKSRFRLEKYINFSLISNCIIFNTLAGCGKGKDKKGGGGCSDSGKDKEPVIVNQGPSPEENNTQKKPIEEEPENPEEHEKPEKPNNDDHDDDKKDKPDNGNAEFNVKFDNIKSKFKNLQDKNNKLPEGFKYDFDGNGLTDTELNNIKNLKQIDEFDKKINKLETEHRDKLVQKIDKINSDREKMKDYVHCAFTGDEFKNSVKSCNIDNVVEIADKIKKEEEKNKESLEKIKTYYLEKIEKTQKGDTKKEHAPEFYDDKKNELKKIEDISDFKNLESDFKNKTSLIQLALEDILNSIIKNLAELNKSKIIDCNIIKKDNLDEFNKQANKFKTKKDSNELKELDRTELEKLDSDLEKTLKDYKKYVSESITALNNCCAKVNNLIDRHNDIITKILKKTIGEIDKLNIEINETDITCTFVEDKKNYFTNQENNINKKISDLIVVLNEKIQQKNELVSLLQKLKYDVTGLEFKEVSNLEEITDDYVKNFSILKKKLDEAYDIVNTKLDNIRKEYNCDKSFYFFTNIHINSFFDTFKTDFENFLTKGFSFKTEFKYVYEELEKFKKEITVLISWYGNYKDFDLEGVKFDDSEEIQNHVKELKEIVKKIEERDYLNLESKKELEKQYDETKKCFNGILEKLSENFKFKYSEKFSWGYYNYSEDLLKNKIEEVKNSKYLYFFKINEKDRFICKGKDDKVFFVLFLNSKKKLQLSMYYIGNDNKITYDNLLKSKKLFEKVPKLEDILNEEFEFGFMNFIVKLKDFLRVLYISYSGGLKYKNIMLKSKKYDNVKILLDFHCNFCEKHNLKIIDIDDKYNFKKCSYDDKFKFMQYIETDKDKPAREALKLQENYQNIINNEQLELNIDTSDVFVKDLSTYDTKGLDFNTIYDNIIDKLEIKD